VLQPRRDLTASRAGLTASRAAQAVMRAVTAYPLSDAQLERVVKLALGKRILAVPTTMASENLPQATTLASRPASDHQAGPKVVSESESESHATGDIRPEGPPLARGVVWAASPRRWKQRRRSLQRSPTRSRQAEIHWSRR
jgi:hypothetical protein